MSHLTHLTVNNRPDLDDYDDCLDDDCDDKNGHRDDDTGVGQKVSNCQEIELAGFGLIILKRIWNFLIALQR